MLDVVRNHLHRKPFHPFRIVMRSGVRYEIIDPEKVAVAKTKIYAFLPRMTEIAESEIELVYEPRKARSK